MLSLVWLSKPPFFDASRDAKCRQFAVRPELHKLTVHAVNLGIVLGLTVGSCGQSSGRARLDISRQAVSLVGERILHAVPAPPGRNSIKVAQHL